MDIPNPVVRPTVNAIGALLPIHKGLVNVAFCDGHVESMSDSPDNLVRDYEYQDIK